MSGPLLSICIATMNRAGYLRETLEGLARQSAPELEVVVLDGGSTDATGPRDEHASRLEPLLAVRPEPRDVLLPGVAFQLLRGQRGRPSGVAHGASGHAVSPRRSAA